MQTMRLHRNIQFMYEEALARLELAEGFDVRERVENPFDPWEWKADLNGHAARLRERSAYVGSIGEQDTVYAELICPAYRGGRFNRTRSVNQYLTHWIYPYKGKFHPQMVRALLNMARLEPGQKVLDPFVGSGTAALESQLLGLDFVGVDISPLCARRSRVKTGAWQALPALRRAVKDLLSREGLHPDEVDAAAHRNSKVREFLEVARMVTYSDMARRGREGENYMSKNLQSMLESVEAMDQAIKEFGIEPGEVQIHHGDCRDLRSIGLKDGSIDAVVTSPPYSLALDYVKNDAHALEALGVDLKREREEFIGVRGRPAQRLALYEDDMRQVFRELGRVVRPGGKVMVVVGDATIGGSESRTTQEMIQWAEEGGLRHVRSLPKIVYGLYAIMTEEKILMFDGRKA